MSSADDARSGLRSQPPKRDDLRSAPSSCYAVISSVPRALMFTDASEVDPLGELTCRPKQIVKFGV